MNTLTEDKKPLDDPPKQNSRRFVFWLLLFLAVGMSLKGLPTAAVVCLVGAALFEAIESIGNDGV